VDFFQNTWIENLLFQRVEVSKIAEAVFLPTRLVHGSYVGYFQSLQHLKLQTEVELLALLSKTFKSNIYQ